MYYILDLIFSIVFHYLLFYFLFSFASLRWKVVLYLIYLRSIVCITSCAMPGHQVDILYNKDCCVLVPRFKCLQPLQWSAKCQQFVSLSDPTVRTAVQRRLDSAAFNLVDTAPVVQNDWSASQVCSCSALYGVLQLGTDTCALVFVTSSEEVGEFSFSEECHLVQKVKKMKWIRLPQAEDDVNSTEDGLKINDAAEGLGSLLSDEYRENFQHHCSSRRDYFAILNAFCRSVETDSSFYFCSTINLASEPTDILSTAGAAPRGREKTQQDVDRHFALRHFQWNHMLQRHFVFPTMNSVSTLPMENCECCLHQSQSIRHVLLRNSSQELDGSVNPVSMLYVPAFIRGFFGCSMNQYSKSYLITRLCCQWSGTRFNRRGLEPGNSGVCANMAISSLWIASTERAQRRVAVFDILRGSIPRRWEQRTNLAIRPPIRLLSSASRSAPVDELTCHLHLVAHIMPMIRYLCCIDSTSEGRGEKVLSEAYRDAVQQYQNERKANSDRYAGLPAVGYVKICVGTLVLKKFKTFDTVSDSICRKAEDICRQDSEDECEIPNFTKWSGASDTSGAENHEDNGSGIVAHQTVYYRVNCVDCIDRTNIVQSCLVSRVIPKMLDYVLSQVEEEGRRSEEKAATQSVMRMLKDQGYIISFLYSGTTHHLTSYPIRGRVYPQDYIKIACVILMRWYQQNFFDGKKQDGVSLITLQHNSLKLCGVDAFSNDFSQLNRDFCYGVVCAVLPLLYSILAMCFSHDRGTGKYHTVFVVLWLVFLFLVYTATRRVRETFTNRPSLLYWK